mmetsp:Transcript_45054/g.71978  ORF Transcript_45054/g.71978 Transcript_45054/m.71978 type:complete len:141 (-) Transcript_45054:9-431(-)
MRFSQYIRCIGGDLHTAAATGDVILVKELLTPDQNDQVLDVDGFTKDYMQMTPAMFASMGGFLDILKILVEHGADINMQNVDGDTCLHLAVEHVTSLRHIVVIDYLVTKGARYEIRNNLGNSAEDLCKMKNSSVLPEGFF